MDVKIRTYTCADCGAEGEQAGRGRPRKRCSGCAAKLRGATDLDRDVVRARKPSTPCATCGKLCLRSSGSLPPGQLRCQDCRRAAKEAAADARRASALDPRACATCGGAYQPVRRDQRWCSRKCKDKGYGVEWRANGGRARLSPEARARQEECWRQKNRRRRAQLRGAAAEPYTTAEIAERDRFRCGLCGKRVPMDVRVPDPLAATIDHILPISEGGDDTRANVQLAHFRCNNVKGARGSQQLALIG